MTVLETHHIVVVGAGHGGGAVVAYLRQYGYRGAITLIGTEPVAPYHRPPLSKAWLKGDVTLASLLLRPLQFYRDQNIQLQLETTVNRIDRPDSRVLLADGKMLAYDCLILATGADPRTLPVAGASFDNVMYLRGVADAERLAAALGPGKRLVVIGGGYVGLETAATARALGADVVVIERGPRLLERVASPQISAFLHQQHRQHGVTIEVGAQLTAIEGQHRAETVSLQDGRSFSCDVVLVGVGASPCMALAQAAGLACEDGIQVDADCRTTDPSIFALGDVAKRPHALYQRPLRLESVPSALEQAKRVAAVLTGREPAPAEVPWFWSDQYDLKLQIAGLPFGATETVVRGDPELGRFAVFHLSNGVVVSVEAVNAPADFVIGKKLIASGKRMNSAHLSDTALSPAELMA